MSVRPEGNIPLPSKVPLITRGANLRRLDASVNACNLDHSESLSTKLTKLKAVAQAFKTWKDAGEQGCAGGALGRTVFRWRHGDRIQGGIQLKLDTLRDSVAQPSSDNFEQNRHQIIEIRALGFTADPIPDREPIQCWAEPVEAISPLDEVDAVIAAFNEKYSQVRMAEKPLEGKHTDDLKSKIEDLEAQVINCATHYAKTLISEKREYLVVVNSGRWTYIQDLKALLTSQLTKLDSQAQQGISKRVEAFYEDLHVNINVNQVLDRCAEGIKSYNASVAPEYQDNTAFEYQQDKPEAFLGEKITQKLEIALDHFKGFQDKLYSKVIAERPAKSLGSDYKETEAFKALEQFTQQAVEFFEPYTLLHPDFASNAKKALQRELKPYDAQFNPPVTPKKATGRRVQFSPQIASAKRIPGNHREKLLPFKLDLESTAGDDIKVEEIDAGAQQVSQEFLKEANTMIPSDLGNQFTYIVIKPPVKTESSQQVATHYLDECSRVLEQVSAELKNYPLTRSPILTSRWQHMVKLSSLLETLKDGLYTNEIKAVEAMQHRLDETQKELSDYYVLRKSVERLKANPLLAHIELPTPIGTAAKGFEAVSTKIENLVDQLYKSLKQVGTQGRSWDETQRGRSLKSIFKSYAVFGNATTSEMSDLSDQQVFHLFMDTNLVTVNKMIDLERTTGDQQGQQQRADGVRLVQVQQAQATVVEDVGFDTQVKYAKTFGHQYANVKRAEPQQLKRYFAHACYVLGHAEPPKTKIEAQEFLGGLKQLYRGEQMKHHPDRVATSARVEEHGEIAQALQVAKTYIEAYIADASNGLS